MQKETEISDVLIAVPSKERVDVLRERTAKVLEGFEYEVFVEPQEADEYAEWNPQVLPKNDQGICYAMAKIKEYAQANDYEYVLKIDDDVERLDVQRIIGEGVSYIEMFGFVAAVSVVRGYKPKQTFLALDTPLQSVFIIKTEYMTEVETDYHHDALQSLKIWEADKSTLQINARLDNDIDGIKGGCRDSTKKKYQKQKFEDYCDNFIPLNCYSPDKVLKKYGENS